MIKAVLLLAVIGSAFAQRQSVYTSLPADGAAAGSAATGLAAAEHTAGLAGRHTIGHAGRHATGHVGRHTTGHVGRHTAGHGGRSVSGHTGGHAGRHFGNTNIFMRMLNNPIRLCRETENMRAIPCARNNVCNVLSMMQYRMPNMLTCSPMGIGCCVKDVLSLHFIKELR